MYLCIMKLHFCQLFIGLSSFLSLSDHFRQYVFVVAFSTFLIECVDYDTLFYENYYNHSHKVTIPEAVYPMDQCFDR